MRRTVGKAVRMANRRLVNERKADGCAHCGAPSTSAILTFHHIGDKRFDISSGVSIASTEDLEREISKCIVLCTDCHVAEHQGPTWPTIADVWPGART